MKPLHPRTDPHVKSGIYIYAQTLIALPGKRPILPDNTLDNIRKAHTLSYLSAEDEEKLRRERHMRKKEAVKRAKKRDEERAKLMHERKAKQNSSSNAASMSSSSGSKNGHDIKRTTSNARYENLQRVQARWNHTHARGSIASNSASSGGGTRTSTAGTNLKQTPFTAIVVDTYAAENEQQVSVTAGTEVVVLNNRQSSTMWQVSVGGKGKEIGWIPSSIIFFY